jgi:hypothetical protein
MDSDSEKAFRPSADSSDEDVGPITPKRPAAEPLRQPAKKLKTSKEDVSPEFFSDTALISGVYIVTHLAKLDKTSNWERWFRRNL